MLEVQIAAPKNDREVLECLELMKVLRPQWEDAATLAVQIQRQAAQGYALLAVWHQGAAVGIAGYRFQENLLYGRFLYVDDLVTAPALRSKGIGARLLEAIAALAKQAECRMLVLDTGASNSSAQQFYRRQGLNAAGMHFTRSLS